MVGLTCIRNDDVDFADFGVDRLGCRLVVCGVCRGELDGEDDVGQFGDELGEGLIRCEWERADTGIDDGIRASGELFDELVADTPGGAGHCVVSSCIGLREEKWGHLGVSEVGSRETYLGRRWKACWSNVRWW
jgi:hypothetical protein